MKRLCSSSMDGSLQAPWIAGSLLSISRQRINALISEQTIHGLRETVCIHEEIDDRPAGPMRQKSITTQRRPEYTISPGSPVAAPAALLVSGFSGYSVSLRLRRLNECKAGRPLVAIVRHLRMFNCRLTKCSVQTIRISLRDVSFASGNPPCVYRLIKEDRECPDLPERQH